MSAIGRCPLLGGVRYWEVSAIGRCPLLGGVRYWEVSAIGRCPLFSMSAIQHVRYSACPLFSMSAIQHVRYSACPLFRGFSVFIIFILCSPLAAAYASTGREGGLRSKSTLAYLEGGREGQKSDFFAYVICGCPQPTFVIKI